ncbi:MAG: phosphate acyltransferase [Bacteroides sp.]|nr:phosphate acyltransferase [Bacteroides sp.]MCM1084981.1 phosphate acyltransferase [Bacteroides sp.]MCM1170215.1 phosphate acyltransferase [Bacteroides sp.]
MKFGLDIMGGDFAPAATIDGAVSALDEIGSGNVIALLGDETLIREELRRRGVGEDRFDIVHCPENISMEEKPLKALSEKPGSGIATGFRMLAQGGLDAFASAGNSGAMLAGAVMSLKCIPGILRPCTCTMVPQEDGTYNLLLDIGTTPDAKPEVMVQFAIIGSIFSRYVLGVSEPKVGLLNVGTEDGKGNLQCQAVFPLLKECPHMNFTGNMEPRDLFKNRADVMLADGFVGNIVLKEIETFYRLIQKRGISDPLFDRLNYEIYGGSPILGVNAPVVLGHGISSPLAIKNMLLQSKRMSEQGLIDALRRLFAAYTGE